MLFGIPGYYNGSAIVIHSVAKSGLNEFAAVYFNGSDLDALLIVDETGLDFCRIGGHVFFGEPLVFDSDVNVPLVGEPYMMHHGLSAFGAPDVEVSFLAAKRRA